MSAFEFEKRLTTTNGSISDVKKNLDRLTKDRAEALARGDADKAVVANREAKLLQERLEDLVITKTALEAKLRIYEKNAPEAAKVREEVSATWPQLVDVTAGMLAVATQAEKAITEGFDKADLLHAKINNLAAKHLQLVGEPLHQPDWTPTRLAYYLIRERLIEQQPFINAPLPPWTYVREAERLGVAAKEKAKAKAAQAARVKLAIEQAPLCADPRCGKPMQLRTNIGRDGEIGLPGSGEWSYLCHYKIINKVIPETRSR